VAPDRAEDGKYAAEERQNQKAMMMGRLSSMHENVNYTCRKK
jgi:hypothetical protein